ncbi:MAG: AAA family ATPase [Anaerolineales bacterium]|nr:AAA family ATPase [Anaerolineales bacterium]
MFHDTTITCHGSTYFIGVNGVGKSTILDAIQFALVGGQRMCASTRQRWPAAGAR